MKRKANHDTGVYKYLQSLGVLDKTPEVIEYAKRVYWNKAKLQSKKTRSKQEKSFTVSFTQCELKDIAEASAMHNMSRSRFIKSACLAYIHRKYLVPNTEAVQKIQSLLALNYSALQELYELEKAPVEVGAELLQRMELVEHLVLQQLIHPKLADNDS